MTTHVPLVDVPKLITKKRIKSYVEIISDELYKKFGINDPKINICGLNPHAGEGGYIGKEEENIIIPIVKSMREKGFNINGPFSADTIFTRKDSDIILAMYHDQALPVIKTLEFGNIVNTTLGLPIVRTSVDHGTALDIAGTNKADAGSLISAINTSIEIVKQKNATQRIEVPNKQIRQRFLINSYTINTIIEILNISENDLVLEVGPGQGALTKHILTKTKNYVGVEKDKKLCDFLLRNRNLDIRNEDILKTT